VEQIPTATTLFTLSGTAQDSLEKTSETTLSATEALCHQDKPDNLTPNPERATPMTFQITPDRLAALSQIETESNGPIAAGLVLYRHSQSSTATSSTDTESQLAALTALVTARWGAVFDPETIQTIAADVETYLTAQVNHGSTGSQTRKPVPRVVSGSRCNSYTI